MTASGGTARTSTGAESVRPISAAPTLTRRLTDTARRGTAHVRRHVAIGLGAYAVFCLWSYASITWAADPHDALAGSNRALLYLVVMTLVVLVPWPARAARAVLALLVIVTSAIALGTLARLPAGGGSLDAFTDGRLDTPLGYANATASFWCVAFWPALAFATGPAGSRAARVWRPAALGSAGLLIQIALLSQSRGAVVAWAVTAALFVALTPRRGQTVLALLVLAAATAVVWGTLFEVRSTRSAAEIGDARTAILVSVAALMLAAVVFERLVGRFPRASARVSEPRVGNGAAATTAAVLAVVALVSIGNPSTWIDARWKDVKSSGYAHIDPTGSRFTGSLGSGRYDFWRVALNEFRAHPLNGIGAGNFHDPYLRARRTSEEPRDPHSFAFQLVSQLGVVGTAAFAVFLGAMLTSAWHARRRADRLLSAALLSGFAMWFVHAQFDRLWAVPELGVLAFALLAIAANLQGYDTERAASAAASPRDATP
jgi:O-Antigen ligase